VGKRRTKKGGRGRSKKASKTARAPGGDAPRRAARYEQVHRVARDVIDRRLWARLDDTDWFLLEIPGQDQPLVVTVLGSAGISRGLWVLRGRGGVAMLEEIRRDSLSPDEMLLRADGLMLGVDRARDVSPAHRRFLRQAGVNPRGDIEVPTLTMMRAGKQPRSLKERDLEGVLWSLRGILVADRQGMLVGGRMRSDDKWATLVLSGSLEDPVVALEWRLPPDEEPEGVGRPTWLPDRGRLEALPLLDETWQVGLPVTSAHVKDCSEIIRTLLVMEVDRNLMLAVHAVTADRADYAAAEHLMEIFSGDNQEGVEGIPSQLQVADELLHEVLAPELRRLGVRCTHVAPVPSPLREAIDSLSQYLAGVPKGSPSGGEGLARPLLAETPDGELRLRDPGDLPQASSDLDAPPERSARTPEDHRRTSVPEEGDIGAWKTVDRQLLTLAMKSLPSEHGDDLRLAARYFGDEELARGVLQDPEIGPVALSALSDWLWLDHRHGGRGPTHAERILDGEVEGVSLMPAERIILEGLIEAPISLFVVRSVEPGRSVVVEDLLRGGLREVRDRTLSESARVEMGVFARIYPVGGTHFISGIGPPLSSLQIGGAQQVLDDLGLETTPKALRRGAHLFGSLWYWQRHLPVIPEIRTNDGEVVQMNKGLFHVADPTRAWQVLCHQPDLEPGEEHLTLVWLEPFGASSDEPSIIAHFALEGEHIEVLSNAASRWERARVLLEGLDGVTLVDHETRSMEEVLSDLVEVEAAEGRAAPVSGSASGGAPSVDLTDPEVWEAISAELRQRQIAWLDDSVPALGGETPREAVRTAAGKRKVQQMIRAMPSASMGEGIEPLEPPRAELRRLLGLPKE